MTCSTPTCTREATRRGLCPACYQREYRRTHSNQTVTDTAPPALPLMDAEPVDVQTIPAPAPPMSIPMVTVTDTSDDPADDAGRLIAEALRSVTTRSRGVSPEVQTALAAVDERLETVTDTMIDLTNTVTQLADTVDALSKREPPPPPFLNVSINNGPVRTVGGPRHKCFPEVMTCAAANIPVMLVGPAGSGKTTLARQVAEALGRPFYFTGAILTKFELLGYCDANGQYIPSVFRRAYAGHGDDAPGVFLWDEMDCSDPQAVKAFNAPLENGHADFPDGCITRGDGHYPIGAANTYGRGADRQYVGANQLDASTLDRFAFIEVDYDENMERTIAGDTPWTTRVQSLRRACMNLKIRHVISPRASLRGNVLIDSGMSRETVENMLIWKGLDPAQRAKIETEAR